MSNITSSERRLVDAGAIGRRLGLGRRAILYFARQGTIPVVRVGRHVRFDTEQIEAWIQAGGRALVGDWRKRAEPEQ